MVISDATKGEILLVEDDPKDELLTVRALRKNRFEGHVAVARDGVEALAYLAECADRPDAERPRLVLLDLNLPRLDGFEVLRGMRQDARLRWIPVVVLSSSREPIDLARSYSLGANSYVRKPVDFREFVEAARQIGNYWLGLNEVPGRVSV